MKVITAIIKPFRVDEVCQALATLNVSGLTITEVKGYGRPKGTKFVPGESVVNFLPRIRLEVAVADDQVEKVLATIRTVVRTGQIGDGYIFVTPLEHAVNIRTDETDSAAI
jgi:nitrogen regulatory protein P-II 2